MPYHYKKYQPGSPEYKKAYSQHLMKKLKKRWKEHIAGESPEYKEKQRG